MTGFKVVPATEEMAPSDARRAYMERLLDLGALRMVAPGSHSTKMERAGRTKIKWKDRHAWRIRVRTGLGTIEFMDHTWVEGTHYTAWR